MRRLFRREPQIPPGDVQSIQGTKKEGVDVRRRRRRRKGEKREQPTKEGEMLTENSKQIGTIAVGREQRKESRKNRKTLFFSALSI